jgi:uncharacterized cupin superfamily protein
MADRPTFIMALADTLQPVTDTSSARLGGQRATLGASGGLTRIAVNVDVLPPGNRSSFAHAESKEDEFVLVLAGRPDVWIDGVLHPLDAGDCVAFPAGTGIAHSFLNNSDADVELLVIGQHDTPGNQLFYPLHPERNEQFRQWGEFWEDVPKRALGSHDGVPRAGTRLAGAAYTAGRPDFIMAEQAMLREVTDPGSPRFGCQRATLGAEGGLTQLGVNLDVLPPGFRSSFPHAEKLHDEFVFALAGKPDLWIDGELYELVEGDAAAFPAGTGIAHTFLNNSDAEVRLVVIGDHDVPGNLLFCPLNPERNEIFRQAGRLWEDAPRRALGPHDGVAKAGTRG